MLHLEGAMEWGGIMNPLNITLEEEKENENRTWTKRTDADEDRDLIDHHGIIRNDGLFSNSGEA